MPTYTASQWDVVVIGGGASGFFAALEAKRLSSKPRVLILEAAKQPLAKVRISGGGRCNVTTGTKELVLLMEAYPRQHKAMISLFRHFGPAETVQWFAEQGVALKTEADGRIFPVSDSSQTIIECFLAEQKKRGLRLLTGCAVETVTHDAFLALPFCIKTRTGESFHAKKVVLATGSNTSGYRVAEALGHTLTARAQSLFTFTIEDPALTALAGLSLGWVKARLKTPSMKKAIEQQGPLLITHWGLSGPCVLRLSAWGAYALQEAHYEAELAVDLLPEKTLKDVEHDLFALKKENSSARQLKNSAVFSSIPKRFWHYLLERKAELALDSQWKQLPDKSIRRLANVLKACPFFVVGKGQFKEEFVTAGGVNLTELHATTLESKITPGLYITGELLNIDGLTGGYNFQNAWTSGHTVGKALAEQFF